MQCFLFKTKQNVIRTGPISADLIFDGEDIELLELKIDGNFVNNDHYEILSSDQLRIDSNALPNSNAFVVETKVRINPEKNLQLITLPILNISLQS